MDLCEEKKLINEALRDNQVFAKLFDEFYPKIFRYIYHRVMDIELTKDITSEVFLKAFKNLGRFRWKGISISGWFYRIATNEVNMYFRRKTYTVSLFSELLTSKDIQRIENYVDESGQQTVEQELQQHQDFLKIQAKVKLLPLKYQEVVAFKYFEGKKIREICEILGKKEGTVKSLLSRGLELLRKSL